MEKRRLGRGLDALLGTADNGAEPWPGEQSSVDVSRIDKNPNQPRQEFDADELSALSDSIKTHGILQPLLVRPKGDHFELIAGERRLRAAQAVGLNSVPVRVVNFNDQQVLEAALVENVQRSDLNPIEKAQGFQEYLSRFDMNHEHLAERLGLARTTITNLVGLLDLEPEVQNAIRVNQITLGHAKVLKGVKDRIAQLKLCKQIISEGLSVHATEAIAKDRKPEGKTPRNTGDTKTAHIKSVEHDLRQRLALPVTIRLLGKDRGQVVLTFESNDDFERILEVLR